MAICAIHRRKFLWNPEGKKIFSSRIGKYLFSAGKKDKADFKRKWYYILFINYILLACLSQ